MNGNIDYGHLNTITGTFKSKLALAITYACNSSCPMCIVDAYNPKKKIISMSLDMSTGIIDQANSSGLEYLFISGGEPTLVPHLPDIVKHAHSKGMKTRVNTNGWKSNHYYWEKLREVGLDYAAVSVDLSHNDPSINRKAVSLKRAMETIETLIEAGIETVVPMTVLPDRLNDEVKIYNSIRDLYKNLGEISETEEPLCIELVRDGKKHYVVMNTILNYNGRTKETSQELHRTKCPSRVDGVKFEDAPSIKVNLNGEVRLFCSTDQFSEVKPDIFNPKDSKSLIRSIKKLISNKEFLEFLENGIGDGDGDVCNFCINNYLNKN